MEHATWYTERAAPQDQSVLSAWQKIFCRRKAANSSLESWATDSSVLLLQFGKREMFLDYALPAASTAQYADKGRRIKKLWGSSRGYFHPSPIEVSMVRTAPKSWKSLNSLKLIYLLRKTVTTVHLLKHWIVFINGTKKLQQELRKNKCYISPIISYSACQRELGACSSTPAYLCLVTSWVLNPLPLPIITAVQKAQQPLTQQLSIYSPALCFVICSAPYRSFHYEWHNTPYSTGGTSTEGKLHLMCALWKRWIWGKITFPFLILFLAVHWVSPAPFAALQPNSFALR